MTTKTGRNETLEQALVRLAQQARDKGVKLCQDPKDGRYYASSVSNPGHYHYVTGYSCDCRGFVEHHRCMHYAALLAAKGWLPQPAPEPSAPAAPEPRRCGCCSGTGEIPSMYGSMWSSPAYMPCPDCGGSGVEQLPAAA